MAQLAAVLTGDIVGSSRAGAQATDRALSALRDAAREMSHWIDRDTKFTRFRGDGWQILLPVQPGLAFRSTLFLSARLRAADTGLATRIAVGIGPVERSGTKDLSDAAGEAFETSGGTLDGMDRWDRILIAGRGVTDWHEGLFEIADWMIRRWSREQAEAAALVLDDKAATATALAERLGISRQAFQARLDGSGVAALATALRAFDTEVFAEKEPVGGANG